MCMGVYVICVCIRAKTWLVSKYCFIVHQELCIELDEIRWCVVVYIRVCVCVVLYLSMGIAQCTRTTIVNLCNALFLLYKVELSPMIVKLYYYVYVFVLFLLICFTNITFRLLNKQHLICMCYYAFQLFEFHISSVCFFFINIVHISSFENY